MNRAQRRLYNKKNKTNYTKEQLDTMMAIERIKNGVFDLSDLKVPQDFIHMDNTELVPDGTEVKLNFESLEARCTHVDKSNELFRNWVAEVKKEPDKIYHVTREEAKNSLVCLAEDEREVEIDGKKVKAPKWLFDVYADVFVKDEIDGVWKSLSVIETERASKTIDSYIEVKNPREAIESNKPGDKEE